MASTASFDFDGSVAVVTGASGALGSAVAERFDAAGATVCAIDVVTPDDTEALLSVEGIDFREADLTDEEEVEAVMEGIVDDHGGIGHLLNIAGTWRGGNPIEETDVGTFDLLFDVNLKTAFLASKHALPHLQESEGSIVSVSAKSSLSGGEGDGPYRITKAGIRLLTETIAAENVGSVRANCVMPSVIDTPANREMMPDADHDEWVDPGEIGDTMLALCSSATAVTSGAAVPVYGDAY